MAASQICSKSLWSWFALPRSCNGCGQSLDFSGGKVSEALERLLADASKPCLIPPKTSENQQEDGAQEQSSANRFSTAWAKQKYETYKASAYRYAKEYFERPWWFQEKEAIARFRLGSYLYFGPCRCRWIANLRFE